MRRRRKGNRCKRRPRNGQRRQTPLSAGRPSDKRPPEVAPLFDQPGVLTPRGKYIFEPGFQFGYSSSNRVALVGYTVIPALLIGLVDVREVKRNTSTASLSVRTGLSNRLEVEARVPYVYRSDATVSREIFTGTSVEHVFDTSGKGLGDVELAGRYQIPARYAPARLFIPPVGQAHAERIAGRGPDPRYARRVAVGAHTTGVLSRRRALRSACAARLSPGSFRAA
ncbi:MAG: hypothetical protein ACXWVG_10095 [Telluria sp.]